MIQTMAHRMTTALLMGCLISVLWAASSPAKTTLSLAPGETAVVRVYYADPATGRKLIKSFGGQLLQTRYGRGYHVMEVTQTDIDRLTAAGLRVEADRDWTPEALIDAEAPETEADTGIPRFPCYRTVEETFETAEQIAAEHPDLARWIDVGDSWEKTEELGGYDMGVLRLTNRQITSEKPALFVTAAMHAREYATAELVTRFAEHLVEGYGLDADATWILDHHEVHLMLHTNPDGRKQAETGILWRKNTNQFYCGPDSDRRGADLNRNFEFNWNCCDGSSGEECDLTYRGPSPVSEPEIQAVVDYMDSLFPDQRDDDPDSAAPLDATGIYIDVHSYGKLVLWPWGSTPEPSPNAIQLQTLGRKFAFWNGYSPEQAYGLYPTDGTSDGHAYGELGVAAYCIEVGTTFFQPCNYFERFIVPGNLPALVYAAKVVRTPYMTPAGPDAVDVALSAAAVSPGTQVELSAVIDDTRYHRAKGKQTEPLEPAQIVFAAEYYVDIPPWAEGESIAMDAADGSFDATVETVSAVIDTTGWEEGQHIVFVRGMDADGNQGAFSALFLDVLPLN